MPGSPRRGEWLATLAASAGATAAALASHAGAPRAAAPAGPSPEQVAADARREDDHAVWVLADPLAAAAAAAGVLRDEPGWRAGLAGLAARLLDLGRAYWPVFSVIVILSGPAARDWK
jgi:hypothetical protein